MASVDAGLFENGSTLSLMNISITAPVRMRPAKTLGPKHLICQLQAEAIEMGIRTIAGDVRCSDLMLIVRITTGKVNVAIVKQGLPIGVEAAVEIRGINHAVNDGVRSQFRVSPWLTLVAEPQLRGGSHPSTAGTCKSSSSPITRPRLDVRPKSVT